MTDVAQRERLVRLRDNLNWRNLFGRHSTRVCTVEETLEPRELKRFLERVKPHAPDSHPGLLACTRLAAEQSKSGDVTDCRVFVSHAYMAHEYLRISPLGFAEAIEAQGAIAREAEVSRAYLIQFAPPYTRTRPIRNPNGGVDLFLERLS